MPNKLSETDACELIQVLMAHALRVFAEFGLYGENAVIPGVGASPKDFVWNIFEGYLTNQIKTKDVPYLLTALRHDIVDKLRSASHNTTDHYPVNPPGELDAENTKCLDGFASTDPRIDDLMSEKSYEDRVRRLVEDDPPLRELVEAVFDLGLYKSVEIGATLDIPASKVEVRKRKLRRLLIKHGIREVPLEK